MGKLRVGGRRYRWRPCPHVKNDKDWAKYQTFARRTMRTSFSVCSFEPSVGARIVKVLHL